MSRYEVKIGEDFQIDAVDINVKTDVASALLANVAVREAKTRSNVTMALLLAIAVALGLSGSLWFTDGHFDALQNVWTTVAVPLGWIGAHYYRA